MPECMAFDEVRIVEDAQAFAAALDEVRQSGRDEAFRGRLTALARANTWRARVRVTMDAVGRARAAGSSGAVPGEAIARTTDASAMADSGRAVASPTTVHAAVPALSMSSAAGALVAEADALPARRLPASLSAKPFLTGTCNVCGRPTRFFRDDPSLDRESLTCEHCRTTSRYRSIAKGLLKAIHARSGIHADAIAKLPAHAESSLRVYDTQAPFFFEPCAYPLPDLLKRCDWIDVTVSSFRPGEPLGAVLQPGVVNQNLETLTFPDASFDVVITSDVMEHVRLDDRAHAEIARVLKPGGVYLFTVPHFRDRRDTFVRVRVHDPKDPDLDEYVTVPEYHGDANAPSSRGVLSYRSYGTEIDDALAQLGFDVTYTFENDDEHGIRNCELFYCVRSG